MAESELQGKKWKLDKIENSFKVTKFDKNEGIRTPKQRTKLKIEKKNWKKKKKKKNVK